MNDAIPSVQRPATRAARLSAIEEALLTHVVTSQSQLSQILADEGICVTQATLSRDLDEMNATKTRMPNGTMAYSLLGRGHAFGGPAAVGERNRASGAAGVSGSGDPDDGAPVSGGETPAETGRGGEPPREPSRDARIDQQLSRVLSGLVTSVVAARNLIVVHTPSGAAQYVASAIDRQPIADVLGTIAGDDTVLIVTGDDETARSRAHWLVALASQL